MRQTLIIFLLFVVCYKTCFSQSDKPLRVEIEAAPDNPALEVIPAGQKGVMLLYTNARRVDKAKYAFQASFYNQNLKKNWVKDIYTVAANEYIASLLTDSCIALLFFNSENRSESVLFTITEVSLSNGEQKSFSGKLAGKCGFSGWVYLNGSYYLAMNCPKEQCSVNEVNLVSGETREFELFKSIGGAICSLKEDLKNNRILLIVSKTSGKSESFTLYSCSPKGEKIFSAEIFPADENKVLNEILILPVSLSRIIVAGTYVHYNEKINSSKPDESVNTGFFTSLFLDSIMQSIHYYNFIDYKNFYNYMSQENLIKIRKKAEKKGVKESDFSLNYKLLLHNLTSINSSYLLTAEVFTPEYRTVTRTTVDFYGRPMPETYTVFDGYRLLNTLLFAFNDSCNYVWDNNFDIFDVLDFDLYKRVCLMPDSSDIILGYNTEGKLVYKVINGSKTVDGPEHIKVDTGHNSDKISEEKKSRLVHWYGSFMLAFGYEKIMNHILPGRNTRSVFYLNKIGYK